ncbi:metacaspase-1-like [Cornus florida]|uniref:metacaspase-1-like n=1 Tax=Cornus florida TaxID=4283 RepID=UPI00289EE892|nr:metacaspase-1-like [Cornus florida]
MYSLVTCSNCNTQLQPPPGTRSIRCAICSAITDIGGGSGGGYAPPPSYGHQHHHQAMSPYHHAPPGPPPAHGRKKAVICAISYKNSGCELKGCINDAKCMRYMLINKLHFPESNVLMLTEEENDPYRIPTKKNMRMAMFWLVQGCQPGDSLLFHYSGHGSQQVNHSGEELDGYDETLCPLDFQTEGMIVDDEINNTLVKPLPHGVRLHAIIDACHSGTVLDLPYLCRMTRSGHYEWEDHGPESGAWKGTCGGEVISFSGCDDHQTSADTAALSKITSTGAMTFSFIQAIEHGQGATYGSILNSMRSTIGKTGGLTQEPQLTSCEPFDVYTKPFCL